MAASCSVGSALRGPTGDGRRRATSRNVRRKTGCDLLGEARRGTLPGLVKTGVTFSEAADEWLRYVHPAAEVERPPIQQSGNIEVWRWLMTTQVAEVPGAISEGKTPEKARANVIDALDVCSLPSTRENRLARQRPERFVLAVGRPAIVSCNEPEVIGGPRPETEHPLFEF
jgi:predicted RNase H-like HicB family nuclease